MHKHFDAWGSVRGWEGFPATAFRIAIVSSLLFIHSADPVVAQPQVLDPDLEVSTHVSGLVTPISIAFLGEDDLFVLEKNTGQVKRVVNGSVQSTVLDLAVN